MYWNTCRHTLRLTQQSIKTHASSVLPWFKSLCQPILHTVGKKCSGSQTFYSVPTFRPLANPTIGHLHVQLRYINKLRGLLLPGSTSSCPCGIVACWARAEQPCLARIPEPRGCSPLGSTCCRGPCWVKRGVRPHAPASWDCLHGHCYGVKKNSTCIYNYYCSAE